jgi:hypothetical protein
LGISLLTLAVRGERDDVAMLGHWCESETGAATVVAGVDSAGEISHLDVVYRSSLCIEALPTHGPAGAASAALGHRMLDLGVVRLGAMVGWEGLVPEVARMFALADIDVVIWAAGVRTPMPIEIARARAMENRLWVALLQPSGAHSASDGASGRVALIDPDGRLVAAGLPGREHLLASVVNACASRIKQITPGTDAFADRSPAFYAELAASTGEPS